MFLDNKWTKWYMELMDSRKRMDRKRETFRSTLHSHHIIPKSMGGSNKKENLVLLTPREHYIAHMMLTKMTTGKHYRGMIFAAMRFFGKNATESYSSRMYEYINKRNIVATTGKTNPFYGKTHSTETIENMRQKLIGKIVREKNGFYGQKHSEATKKLLSEQKSKRLWVSFSDGKEMTFANKIAFADYMGWSYSIPGSLILNPHRREKYGVSDLRVLGSVERETGPNTYYVRTNDGRILTFKRIKDLQEFYGIETYEKTHKLFRVGKTYTEEKRIRGNRASNSGYSVYQRMKDLGIMEAWVESNKDKA